MASSLQSRIITYYFLQDLKSLCKRGDMKPPGKIVVCYFFAKKKCKLFSSTGVHNGNRKIIEIPKIIIFNKNGYIFIKKNQSIVNTHYKVKFVTFIIHRTTSHKTTNKLYNLQQKKK